MRINETNYPFLLEDLKDIFGEKNGVRIFKEANRRFLSYNKEADFKNNEELKNQLQLNIFPMLAFYNALIHCQREKEKAINFASREIKKQAEIEKANYEKLAKKPFLYNKIKSNRFIKNNFPSAKIIKSDKNEVNFEIENCVYKEVINQYSSTELTKAFSEAEAIKYSGLMPKVKFEKSKSSENVSCFIKFIKN